MTGGRKVPCTRCGKPDVPHVHPWADNHPATPDEMCGECFRAFLEKRS